MFLPKNCLFFYRSSEAQSNLISSEHIQFNIFFLRQSNKLSVSANCKMLTLADYTVISLVSRSLLFVVVRNLLTLTRATLMI